MAVSNHSSNYVPWYCHVTRGANMGRRKTQVGKGQDFQAEAGQEVAQGPSGQVYLPPLLDFWDPRLSVALHCSLA